MSDLFKPFKVETVDGVKVAESFTLEEAEQSAAERNVRAESLGISARYRATENR